MRNEPETDPAADDPDIAALLDFTPVERKNKRRDGWSPWHQRRFIAWLAVTGNVDKAAQAVGRTQSGAWNVRNSAGGEGFSQAWDAALDLFHARRRAGKLAELRADPPGERHTARHAREAREARAFRGKDPELEEEEKAGLLGEILKRYLVKLKAERTARLDGRIVEADFYVRQLSVIELILDIGGRTQELLAMLDQPDFHLVQVSATPGSTLLEKIRRKYWSEKGEADRPPPAPLGRHNHLFATGRDDYDPARDGDRRDWERAQAEKQRLAAEAQAEWERRAKGEAGEANDNDPAPQP